MLGKVFERFVDHSPISVMVRGTLERVLGAAPLALWEERTARKPETRAVLFSTISDLMSHVVLRLQPSVHAAERAQEAQVGPSVGSVDNTLQESEPHTAAACVRESARQGQPLIEQGGGARAPWWPGSQVQSVAGNARAASAPWLKACRGVEAGALPGQARVVYEPTAGWVSAVLPGEDGHAQERSWLTAVLGPVRTGDLWRAERHVCTRALLCALATRGASCVLRPHRGVPLESLRPLPPLGRGETGSIAAPRGRVVEAPGGQPVGRRRRLTRHHATRDGAPWLDILTP
jgi:hypothetical protein